MILIQFFQNFQDCFLKSLMVVSEQDDLMNSVQLQPLALLAKNKSRRGSKCFAHLFFLLQKAFYNNEIVFTKKKNEGDTNKVRPLVPLYKNRQLRTNCSPQKQFKDKMQNV